MSTLVNSTSLVYVAIYQKLSEKLVHARKDYVVAYDENFLLSI